MLQEIYLDNNTARRPAPRVLDALACFASHTPGAPHSIGQQSNEVLEEAYGKVYSLCGLNAEKDDLVITSSGAEAVNHVLWSHFLDQAYHDGCTHVVVGKTSEAPAIMGLQRLQQLGVSSDVAEADGAGTVTRKAVADALTPRTSLVSVSWVNGVTGVVNDLYGIAEVCQEQGVLLHIDVTHGLGKLFLDLEAWQPAYLTFDGAPLGAPAGTGGVAFCHEKGHGAWIAGGGEQGGLRAGMLNVGLVAALGEAAALLEEQQTVMGTEVARLRKKLETAVSEALPDSKVLFKNSIRAPNTSLIAFSGINNDHLCYLLNEQGIYASFGGGMQQLARLHVEDPIEGWSAVSFALSPDTTEEQIDRLVAALTKSCAVK